MIDDLSSYRIDDLKEGMIFSIEIKLSEEDIDNYSRVSGDISPIHIDDNFASKRGFPKRVAHGLLLASYLSRIVGVHLPGRNAFLQSINLHFLLPVYAGDTIRIGVVVDQVSTAANTIVLKAHIENIATGKLHARGKLQVGFTEEKL